MQHGKSYERPKGQRATADGLPVRQGRARGQGQGATAQSQTPVASFINNFMLMFGVLSRRPNLAITVMLVLALGLRLFLALSTDGYLGVDGGAYRLSLLYVTTGQQIADFVRPPLAPGWLLWPTTAMFGAVTGFNLYGAIFSMTLPLAVWYAARVILSPWRVFAVVLLVAFDWLLMSMFVTGAVPLTGFAFIFLSLGAMWRISRKPGSRHAIVLIVALPLIFYTNQTSAGLAMLIIPLQWILLPNRRMVFIPLALGGLLALSALPWYFDVGPGSDQLTYPGPLLIPHNIWEHQLLIGLGALYLAFRAHSAINTIWWGDRQWAFIDRALLAVVYTVPVLAIMQMFASFNEVIMNITFRATYLMMPFIWILAVHMFKPGVWTTAKRVFAVLAVMGLVTISVQQFTAQRTLSALADGDVVATFQAVPEDADTVLTNNYSTALFLAAETGHNVQWTNWIAPPPFYEQADAEARCAMGWVEGCEVAPHITHILVDEKWPMDAVGLAPANLLSPYGAPERKPWALLAQDDRLELIAAHGSAKLYEVRR